jgi:hypothetical protein
MINTLRKAALLCLITFGSSAFAQDQYFFECDFRALSYVRAIDNTTYVHVPKVTYSCEDFRGVDAILADLLSVFPATVPPSLLVLRRPAPRDVVSGIEYHATNEIYIASFTPSNASNEIAIFLHEASHAIFPAELAFRYGINPEIQAVKRLDYQNLMAAPTVQAKLSRPNVFASTLFQHEDRIRMQRNLDFFPRYNEFFADVVAITYTRDPDAMFKEIRPRHRDPTYASCRQFSERSPEQAVSMLTDSTSLRRHCFLWNLRSRIWSEWVAPRLNSGHPPKYVVNEFLSLLLATALRHYKIEFENPLLQAAPTFNPERDLTVRLGLDD